MRVLIDDYFRDKGDLVFLDSENVMGVTKQKDLTESHGLITLPRKSAELRGQWAR